MLGIRVATGDELETGGAEQNVVSSHQLAGLGLAERGFGVEEIDHLFETLLETVFADPQGLVGGGENALSRGVTITGGLEILPCLANLEPDALLESTNVGLEGDGVVLGGLACLGVGDAAEEVDPGDRHDGSRVAVGTEDGVVVETVATDHRDLGEIAGSGDLGLEAAGGELLSGGGEIVPSIDGRTGPLVELTGDRLGRRNRRQMAGCRLIGAHVEVERGLGELGAVLGLLEQIVHLGEIDLGVEDIGRRG